MPFENKNIGSILSDPKQATEYYLRETRVRGLTPLGAVLYAVGPSAISDDICHWDDAGEVIFRVFKKRMSGISCEKS